MKHFVFVLFLTFYSFSQAQELTQFSYYSINNGLSENNVTSLLQDKKGNMWFGTYDGLDKFDGYSFKVYKGNVENKFSLQNYQIDKIKQDRYGFIWIQTKEGRVYRFDPLTERFLPIPQCADRFRSFKRSLKISGLFNDGSIWLSSMEVDGGVFKIKYCNNTGNLQIAEIKSNSRSECIGNIRTMLQDQFTNTWILTHNKAYLVRRNSQLAEPFRMNKPANNIYAINDDSSFLYFGCENGLFCLCDSHRNVLTSVQSPFKGRIIDIHKVNNTELFILTDNDGFGLYNLSNNKFLVFNKTNGCGLKSNDFSTSYMDKQYNIWLETADQSIVYFEVNKRKINYFSSYDDKMLHYPSNSYSFITEDKNNTIWVQLKGVGICRYNKEANKLEPFYNGITTKERMFPNMVRTGMFDRQGNLWLCPINFGLVKVVFRQNPFICHKIIENQNFLEQNQIRSVFQDKNKQLWVGTKNGLLYLFDTNRKLLGWMGTTGRINGGKPLKALIYNITTDHTGAMWLSSKGQGLFRFRKIGKKNESSYEIKNFRHDPKDIYSINSNVIYYSFEDSHHRLWIATFDGGLNLVEEKNGQLYFINYLNRLKNYPVQECYRTRFITEDNHGLIYVASIRGMLAFKPIYQSPEKIMFHLYNHNSKDAQSISANDIHCILPAKDGNLYIGTYGGGLNVVRNGIDLKRKPAFKVYTKNNGAVSDVIYTLQEDSKQEIWASTQTKIIKFNPKTERFDIYNPVVSCPFNFMEATASKTEQGDLIYGTTEGFIQFNPKNVKENIFIPRIVLSQLQILNKNMEIGTTGSPLKKDIDDESKIQLDHAQNIISIGYSALDFTDPSGIQYAYKLDGVDKDWNYVGNQRIATYTNLQKGTYVFHVKSTNADGIWTENEKNLVIQKLPSFWESGWGIMFYITIFILILFLSLYILFTYYKLKNDVMLEHRVTNLKLRFFSDISHELRTPLTLIVAPVEHILQTESLPTNIKEQLIIVKRNADRMLRLINQLLDFKKVQSKKMKLILEEIHVGNYIKEISLNFCDLAKEKKITFTLEDNSNNALLWVDKDKFEKIIFNLLSNAFKYTQKGKQIKILMDENEDKVIISVIDQGIGIGKDMLKKIFNRFESLVTTNSLVSASTGIGLSLTKELVELHNATIEVVSEPGEGSVFKLLFLKGYQHFQNNEDYILQDSELCGANLDTNDLHPLNNLQNNLANKKERSTILIVEDNSELRSVLLSILQNNYTIFEASNGKEALAQLSDRSPDLIISDIMMPEMDGLEFTKKIKDDINFSHIPLILLTAKEDIESKLDAMKYCVDDYITKPFSSVYLEARVENILRLRMQLQEYYSHSSLSNTSLLSYSKITSKDDLLMTNIIQHIQDQIDDSKLSIDEIAISLGLSRSSLFKKIKSLTGLAPIDFIKELRLQKAAILIESGDYNISQVSYMVGFEDPRYFSKCFKHKFGDTPSEYKGKHHSGNI
jgi:signal transduction histidine kinase/DNA-binding response OmpR family regulator/ligand-binding sensor domain-containing protein